MVITISLSLYYVALFHIVIHAYYEGLLFLGTGVFIYIVVANPDFKNLVGSVKKIIFITIKILPLMVLIFFSIYYIMYIIYEREIFLALPLINRVILFSLIFFQLYTCYLVKISLKSKFFSDPKELVNKFIIWMNNCGTFLVIILITFGVFMGLRLRVIDDLTFLEIPYLNILFISFISFWLPITYFKGIISQCIFICKGGHYKSIIDF